MRASSTNCRVDPAILLPWARARDATRETPSVSRPHSLVIHTGYRSGLLHTLCVKRFSVKQSRLLCGVHGFVANVPGVHPVGELTHPVCTQSDL